MSNQAFTYGTAQNLRANAFSRTGYTFVGWATSATGSKLYDDKQSVNNLTTTNNGTVTLYALWTANQYTVTLDKQGGNGGSSLTTATYDAAMPAITVPTRTGYTFGGYFTESNGGGTKYYNADGTSAHIWDITATTTLYAKWTANQYTVTLDGQSATTAGTTEVTATYDAAMPAITVPTRTGYTFGGYYTAANGGGIQYYNADGTSAHIWDITAAATTLYAKWTAITYTITYNLNGGTLETDKNSYTIESPDITLDEPTRDHYTFLGWYENSGLTGTAVTTIDHGSTGDKQFWAKWLVPYIDADGKTQTCSNFTVLTDATNIKNLNGGWYVVTEDVSYNSKFFCGYGDMHLILCDGAKMTVEDNFWDAAVDINDGSLTIYAQSTGSSMGQLEATASTWGIDAYGSVTICGGNITVTGGNNEEGIRAEGSITIHSGQVRASGGSGIYAGKGDITLGLRHVTDYITASSYNKNVNIADGQTLIDGTAAYTGNNVSIPAGQTLQLPVPVTLADGITATSGIVEIGDDYYAKAGATVTVSTSGVTAGQGYTCSGITVTPDADVTDNGNGTYSFTMPAEDATVSAVFAPIDWANEGRSGDDNANAYMIYNKDQLLLLAYRVNGTHGETANSYNGKWFRLGADIKFTYDPNEGEDDYEENYEAIGAGGISSFRGSFDGKGHTISGIRIRKTGTSTADSYQGLFGYISGNVSNIHLTDARIQGHHYVGGIGGYNVGDVGFTDVTDSYITANGNYGTICGYNFFGTDGLTRNYYHHCTVNGTAKATNVGCNGANITYNDAAIPLPVLSDTEDNTDAIATLSTRVSQGLPMFHSVMLEGRTLSKNGEWNTLCLPFHVLDGDSRDGLSFTGTPLEGATVKELNVTTSNLTNGTLTLNFTTVSSIEAGKPYIVKWEGTSGSLSNPIFQGISVTSTEPTAVTFTGGSFVGQYSPFSITADNIDEIILLSTGNRLGYSKNERTLRSFRAHFEVPTSGGVREFVLDFGEETTAVFDLKNKEEITNNEWYTLDGRKLDAKPTKKGVYIRNGKKIVIK